MNPSEEDKNIDRPSNRQIRRDFASVLHSNSRFRALEDDDKKEIEDVLDKYRDRYRRGLRVSGYGIRKDLYSLYRNYLKMGLRRSDIDKIKTLLKSLKD